MFGLGKKAQPKDAYEQPEIVEDAPEVNSEFGAQSNRALLRLMKSIEERLPISLYTEEQVHGNVPRAKVNPNIISKVWK